MMRSAIAAWPRTRSDRAKIGNWVRHVKKRVRAARRGKHDSHLVRGDDDLSEAIVDYSSIAYYGWTWPGEGVLAEILNESDRNIRKRIARLRKAKLLVVISPGDKWHSNRYIPLLDGRPLFEVALTSEQVRDAIAALQSNDCDTGTPVPLQDTAESGTPIPPKQVNAVLAERNARSAESSRNNSQEGDSPTPYTTPQAAPMEPRGQGEMLGPELQEANAAAPCELALEPHGTREQRSPPNGYPSGQEPEVRAHPARAERAAAPVVEFSLACLVRDYPHPGEQRKHPAYEPVARRAWRALSDAQKAEAINAAPHAPGKIWLGHWLNNARETGVFEILKQPSFGRRVWVAEGTPQHAAWAEYYRSCGRPLPRTQHRIDGQLRTGWMFEGEWPPNSNFVPRDGRAA
jgi:hypothetical protein